ncbi:MAG TPA: acetate/propionate family kinase [Thermoanaerobacterales bacterium]|nr:acetate/propionate family kinase [Thermoanaerobacterales bacterium]
MNAKYVLVCNPGSTSLKYKLFQMDDEQILAEGRIERVGSDDSIFIYESSTHPTKEEQLHIPDYQSAVNAVIKVLKEEMDRKGIELKNISAVGFKIVHAGKKTGTLELNDDVLEAMKKYSFVAPAHNPPYITAINIFKKELPNTPMIGVFETSFHSTISEYAYTYGIPKKWREKYDIRRYGFHGASHRYVSERVSSLMGKNNIKVITCHLGGSSSICAVENGRSIDTSLGFSLQSGVQHNNRCGDIDPFILLYIMEKEGLSPKEVADILVNNSGLKGLSGVGNDLRDIEESAYNGIESAKLAIDVFCYEIKKYIGSYIAILGGIDAIAFAGGIGENGIKIREKVCKNLDHLGISIDIGKNRGLENIERLISDEDSKVKVFVIPTNEEIVVARECIKLLYS